MTAFADQLMAAAAQGLVLTQQPDVLQSLLPPTLTELTAIAVALSPTETGSAAHNSDSDRRVWPLAL